MTHSLTKHLKQRNATLSDLDGLLVNSENFNQLLIQRIDPEWMAATIARVLKSDTHLKRLTQILVSCIVGENHHPDRVYHALAWFTQLLESPAACQRFATDPVLRNTCRPLISYANEMSALTDLYDQCAVRATAIQQWAKGLQSRNGIPHNLYYGGLFDVPSTGYVFVDDSDEEFGQRSARRQAKRHGRSGPPASTGDKPCSTECMDSLSELDDFDLIDDAEDDDDELVAPSLTDASESDHGVFDVNETASSEDLHSHDDRPSGSSPYLRSSSTDQHRRSGDAEFLEQTDGLDDQVVETDEEGSSDSDEELDLLMWTRGEQSDNSASDSGNELSDQQTTQPVGRPSASPRKIKAKAKSAEPGKPPRRSTRRNPDPEPESTPTSSRPKRTRRK